MSRNLTTSARSAIHAAETGEAFLILLTFTHASLEEPIRVSSDTVNTLSRGDTYAAYPFDLTLPDDGEGRSPRARLVIDNVDRQIMMTVRSLATAPVLKIEIVRASDPDTVEAVFHDFTLRDVTYDSKSIEGELSIEDFTAEPYPAGMFTPSLFPGLF